MNSKLFIIILAICFNNSKLTQGCSSSPSASPTNNVPRSENSLSTEAEILKRELRSLENKRNNQVKVENDLEQLKEKIIQAQKENGSGGINLKQNVTFLKSLHSIMMTDKKQQLSQQTKRLKENIKKAKNESSNGELSDNQRKIFKLELERLQYEKSQLDSVSFS